MKFGVLKDIKNGEYRVVATPAEVSLIAGDGHEVYVASKAGYAAGFDDKEYAAAGATILATNEEIWAICDFVAKVKEIEPSEYDLMREGQMIFCCIHPAAHREEVDALLLWHLFQVVPVAYSGFKIGANLGVLGEIGILRVFFADRLLNGRLALLLLRRRFCLLGNVFPTQITLGCEETAGGIGAHPLHCLETSAVLNESQHH